MESLNIGAVGMVAAKSGFSGIDKQPVPGPVWVQAPEPGGSALTGDSICDTANHGGADQAVYAYAREDLVRRVREDARKDLALPYLAGGQPADGQRQHVLVDPVQTPLAFAHDDRVERRRDRGTSISSGPISVSTAVVRVPLRELGFSRPPGSWRS